MFIKTQIEILFASKKEILELKITKTSILKYITKTMTISLVKKYNTLLRVAEQLSALNIFKKRIMNHL